MPSSFRPKALLAELIAYGVDFIVVGGIAATLHGSAHITGDLDICPAGDAANLDLLGRALLDLEARLRGVEEDAPFVPDGRALGRLQILTLDTKFGPLDIVMRPDGSPPYQQLKRRAVRMDVGAGVLVTSVDDLIAMKESAGRDKDRTVVQELKAIKRLERRLRRS